MSQKLTRAWGRPSFIAAGQKATRTGMPLVARCDLFWPEHAESSTNHQYMLLEDILVAPIWDSAEQHQQPHSLDPTGKLAGCVGR